MLTPRRVACLVVSLLLVATPASVALAHQAAPSLVAVVDGVEPAEAAAGLEVQVQASQDATLLAIRPTGGSTVELLDEDGAVWARVTSADVEVDVTSPAFHAASNADGRVPDPLPTTDDPWVVVGRDGRFLWFEHRLHPAGLEVPAEVLTSRRPQDVTTWSVPIRVDGEPAELLGRLRHVPVTGRVQARMTSPRELAPGVVVEVASGAVPVVFVRNDGPVPVTVLGREGMPYVRIDAAGAHVNRASSTWAEQQRVEGAVDEVPEGLAFETVSATPSHSWLDSRTALPGLVPDEEVRAAGRTVELFAWSLPVEVGDELLAVEGVTEWVPFEPATAPSTGVRPEFVVAGVVALALLGALLLRRRASATA